MDSTKRGRCHFRVLNLYRFLRGDKVPPNQRLIIKELLETDKCQEFHDLKAVRQATVSELVESAPSKSLAAAQKSEVCAQVTAHYQTWYEAEVLRTLRWHTRTHYFCTDYNYTIQFGTSLSLGSAFAYITRNPAMGAMVTAATGAFWNIFKKP